MAETDEFHLPESTDLEQRVRQLEVKMNVVISNLQKLAQYVGTLQQTAEQKPALWKPGDPLPWN